MAAFASVPAAARGATDFKALEKEFVDRVYSPVMADLMADAAQNAEIIRKLKAAKLDMAGNAGSR